MLSGVGVSKIILASAAKLAPTIPVHDARARSRPMPQPFGVGMKMGIGKGSWREDDYGRRWKGRDEVLEDLKPES